MTNPRWKHRPPGSNWGDFGPDDQLGRLNLLTAKRCCRGSPKRSEGMVFCLSLPLDFPGGNVLNPAGIRRNCGRPRDGTADLQLHSRRTTRVHRRRQRRPGDDVTAIFDAMGFARPCRRAVRRRRRRCRREGLLQRLSRRRGLRRPRACDAGLADPNAKARPRRALGIEHMAAFGVQGRGVMIDLRDHFGDDRKAVGYDELMRCGGRPRRGRAGRHGLLPYRLRRAKPRDEPRAGWRVLTILRRARRA